MFLHSSPVSTTRAVLEDRYIALDVSPSMTSKAKSLEGQRDVASILLSFILGLLRDP